MIAQPIYGFRIISLPYHVLRVVGKVTGWLTQNELSEHELRANYDEAMHGIAPSNIKIAILNKDIFNAQI